MALAEIDTLKRMFSAGAFEPCIDYIRFPYFRNLERDARVDFGFPLTVFVGPNGCGKSSALQALYGCPLGKSVGDYWFNTTVDPIEEMSGGERNCLIYSYDRGGAAREVLKTRIAKRNKPDLWDTSEPLARYGMDPKSARVKPVEKNVVYLNFRAGLSAFEKKFHEEIPPASDAQEFLRHRSYYLKRVQQGAVPLPHFRGKTHKEPVRLTSTELLEVSKILGRTYRAAVIIQHRLFNNWGYSVMFETAHAKYSEAFAGSGETTVALLVHEILSAPTKSLVLLDEPETSLHPGAQRKMLEFLLRECIRKQHQIVICSHATSIVEALPPEAIKVFSAAPGGRFRVFGGVYPSEAFHFLGRPVDTKAVIIVEDRLAKAMLDSVLQEDAGEQSMIEVRYFPGGAAVMKQDAVVHSRVGAPVTFLALDGGERPASAIFDPDTLNAAQLRDHRSLCDLLDERIKEATGANITFPVDGGATGGDLEQKVELRQRYLRYLRERVRFLPFTTPEEELWDETLARELLTSVVGEEATRSTFETLATGAKEKFAQVTTALLARNGGSDITVIHAMFITAWKRRETRAGSMAALRALFDEVKAAL